MSRYASNDIPVQDGELGQEVSDFEQLQASRAQVAAFDADDLQDIVFLKASELLAALRQGDASTVGQIIATDMREACERRANYWLYGKAQTNATYRAQCGGKGWPDMHIGSTYEMPHMAGTLAALQTLSIKP